MRRGLTLGKFAPLHRGHQLLIETALDEVDELVVMVYATDVIEVPLQVRAGWIRKLYPSVRIIEAWDGPDGYGDTPEICREQENYILQKLNGLRITHFYSSEFYGDHVSRALGAIDRRIDEARIRVPASGTSLREDYFAGREYLAPLVYADLVTKVCFMGAPSTGKTTLARTLAKYHNTCWMPEYGAEYWLAHHVDRRISLEQFEQIAPEHNRREDALVQQARKYLFCDTNPITTYVFAKDYHGTAGPCLSRLAQEAEKRYDLFFLCDADIPYDDTWDRSGDQKRKWFQNQIVGDMAERKIPFFKVSGPLEDRVSQVNTILCRYRKYGNMLDVNMPQPLPETLQHFISQQKWIFAKTYAATWPHEYIVEDRVDGDLFAQLAHHIDTYGYTDYFYQKPVIYFEHDGYAYWHMGIIINRCVVADTFHRRKQDGRLPAVKENDERI